MSMRYLTKSLIVLTCIALSGFGIFLAFFGALLAGTIPSTWTLLLVLWPVAAFAFCRLSLAWMEGRRLGRKLAFIATMVGLLGSMAFPAMLHLSGRETLELPQFIGFVGVQLLLVLPAFLLAVYLTWFHSK
jgi:hypothetical protein